MSDRSGLKTASVWASRPTPVALNPRREHTSDTLNAIIEGPHLGKTAVCIPILRSLPEWFGIEDSIVHYALEIDRLPTFLARTPERVIGFLSLKQHSPYSPEIYVMGIHPGSHRRGIGRALMDEAEVWLRKQGIEYIQVKTLGPSSGDSNYAKTRSFFTAMGFRPLEEFPRMWNEENPCLQLVKRL